MHAHPESQRKFLPAAGHDWLLPFYDPFVKLAGGGAIRRKLIRQAEIQPGHNVLEIGSGTAEVLLAIKKAEPSADVTGLDPDPNALQRAQRKAARKKVSLRFDQGFSDQLPYQERSFDRVVSSFMFHHLNENERLKTLQEARRVLKDGGSFHLVDFESSRGFARMFHSSERLKDNSPERILALLKEAGFSRVQLAGRSHLLIFPVAFYKAEY